MGIPILSKVMESIITDQLRHYLEANCIPSPHQHGFRRSRSCTTNLLLAREEWTSVLDSGTEIDAIYLDFSKAFDRVNHSILLTKLAAHGIGDPLLSWISSYLSSRSIAVRVSGTTSLPGQTYSGVPQGSVLGPLLFLIYINDFPPLLSSPCLLFADGIKLWTPMHSVDDP